MVRPTIIEYIGPAGAGKTTLARKRIRESRARGEEVLTYNYYHKNLLKLILDLLNLLFLLITKDKQVNVYENLFLDRVYFHKKAIQTVYLLFVFVKIKRLIKEAKKNNIQKIILDQGFVQKIFALLMGGLIQERKVTKHLFSWIREDSYFVIKRISVTPSVACERRIKRQSRIDIDKSRGEIISETVQAELILSKIVRVTS